MTFGSKITAVRSDGGALERSIQIQDARFQVLSAREILATKYPEPRWAVPGIVPEGLSFLAGRPKIGKSWLALDAAIARAKGGLFLGRFPVAPAPVIYGALEDSPRRIQTRLNELGISTAPDGLNFFFSMPRLDQGGLDELQEWVARNKGCGLVVLDVYNRVRPTRPKNADPYQHDSEQAALLQKVATELAIPILVLTHDRKAISEDWLDQISGTLGTSGSADAVMLLTRDRASANGRLQVIGRDLEEKDFGLEFHGGVWRFIGEGEVVHLSPQRQKILTALNEHGPMTPSRIAERTSLPPDSVRQLVLKMRDQLFKDSDGRYDRRSVLPDHRVHTE